jgi:hypothetical protein
MFRIGKKSKSKFVEFEMCSNIEIRKMSRFQMCSILEKSSDSKFVQSLKRLNPKFAELLKLFKFENCSKSKIVQI